ncbi:hypothetical protein ACFQ4X_07085 [Fictibacillus halophilus]|uniref:hypothetical protein n=1 Tax=Fictibacillus halophilus TaxID=1610490 RepID=UPI003635D0F8
MKLKLKWLYLIILLIPIIINYGLLSWTAPGVSTNTNPWLAFLGSYLGFIGAISIALLNTNNQQLRNEQIDKEGKRSLVVVNDFFAPMTLHNINTHENSRLIETENYSEFSEIHKHDKDTINISFIKLSHFGNSDVILDTEITIQYRLHEAATIHEVQVHIGIMEKNIEVFVPLIVPNIKQEEHLLVDVITVNYKTLMNEKFKYIIDHLQCNEFYYIVNEDNTETPLYELNNTSGSTWIYPKKLEKIKT